MNLLLNSFCTYHTHLRHFCSEKQPHDVMPPGFEPFLKVERKDGENPTAMLRVKFRVRRLNWWQRKALPIVGIPFFTGMPGFVSKVYGINETTNTFMGQYEWRSAQDAQNYIDSGAGRFMRKNAYPHTIDYEITAKETVI